MRLNLHYGHDINTGVFQRITRSLDNQVTAPLNDIRSAPLIDMSAHSIYQANCLTILDLRNAA